MKDRRKLQRIFWSTNPAVTHAVYAYPRFWHEDGIPIDFGESPIATTLKRASKLAAKYYPNAVVLEATADTIAEWEKRQNEREP